MHREFVRMPEFEKCWANIGLNENDIIALEEFLCLNPHSGRLLEGTGGLRKLRWALPNKGKSSSIRIIYIDFIFYEKIYLISAYSKNEKENLTRNEKNEIKKVIKLLEDVLRKK